MVRVSARMSASESESVNGKDESESVNGKDECECHLSIALGKSSERPRTQETTTNLVLG